MRDQDQAIIYDSSPAVMTFADSAAGHAANEALVAAIGGRTNSADAIDRAVDRLDEVMTIDAVLIDISRSADAAADRLLDRLHLAAAHGRYPSVVRAAPELIDLVVARASHADIQIVVGDDRIEAAAALGMALASTQRALPALADERVGESLQLRQLSEEVGRIAQTLARLSGLGEPRLAARIAPIEAVVGGDVGIEVTAAAVRTLIRARRLRDQYFPAALFADPAWDMLLDLMAARLEGRQVAVSSLCIAAAVPPTTALRWMKQLVDDGLLVRVADPRDGRRIFIELADRAADGIVAYWQAIARIGITIG